MSYNSAREIAIKMDSEGGLAEMLFSYGFHSGDIPEDVPDDMVHKMCDLIDMAETYDEVKTWLYERLDEEPNPGDWDYEEPDDEEPA